MLTKTDNQKPKRVCVPWYKQSREPVRCPTHGEICIARNSKDNEDGSRTQFRYCPSCGWSKKIVVPSSEVK